MAVLVHLIKILRVFQLAAAYTESTFSQRVSLDRHGVPQVQAAEAEERFLCL